MEDTAAGAGLARAAAPLMTTQAERNAGWEAEIIEEAIRAYAGVEEYDEWPDRVLRPMPRDSYVVRQQDVEYVVLRRQRNIVAVIDVADGDYTVLTAWPKEIGSR